MASAYANERDTALIINHEPFKIRLLLFFLPSFLAVRFVCCRLAPDFRRVNFRRANFLGVLRACPVFSSLFFFSISFFFFFSISFLFLWGLPRFSSFPPLVLWRHWRGRQGLLPVALFSPWWILVRAYRPRDGKRAQGRDSLCESER